MHHMQVQADPHIMGTVAAKRCHAAMQSKEPSSHRRVPVPLRDMMAGSSLPCDFSVRAACSAF